MKRMKVNGAILLPVVVVLFCSTAIAEASAADYFSRNAEGWFWYEKPEVIQDEEKQEKAATPADTVATVPDDPLDQLERIQKTIARAEARAVLYPTEENVGEYLRLNQWQLNQSSLFSDVWRRVVWQTPDLDYSLRRPVTNLAVHEFQDQKNAAQAQAVAQIAKTHGLFFFFKGSCPYCHAFGPILRRFSEMYGIDVLPVSLDGGTLPDFPQARTDTRVATELGVETVPSVFLVDPRRRNVVPVGAGVMSVDELAERIYVLTQTEPGKDY
jgi:type-F conjugative transfer system pilin assembly protein TraF